MTINTSAGSVTGMARILEMQEEVLKQEKQLREARRKLERANKDRYRGTDSETEQSGYESSGYDYTPTFSSYRQVYTAQPTTTQYSHSSFFSNSQTNQSGGRNHSTPNSSFLNSSFPAENTIESGPSFNESLQRFKTASGHNAQMANWKANMKISKSTSSTSQTVQQRVEETRTMITQSSQKSYHIE
jgi:hypothetical protein